MFIVVCFSCYGQNIYSVPSASGIIPIFDNYCNMFYVSGDSYIMQMDENTGLISVIAGTGITAYNGDGPGLATNISPEYLVVDNYGNIFFSDKQNSLIRELYFDGGWQIKTIAGNYSMGPGYNGDGILAVDAQLNYPVGLAIDNSDNLYISDNVNSRIRIVDLSTGIINTFCGTGMFGITGDGGPAISATLGNPAGIKFNSDKSFLYVVDNWAMNVRRIDMNTGIISLFAGDHLRWGTNYGDGGLATLAGFFNPTDIAIDNLENVYIDDFENNKIRKINSSGIISTYAGNGVYGWTGDGGSALIAEINSKWLSTDQIGNIFLDGIRYVGNNISLSITSSVSGSICANLPLVFTANLISPNGTTDNCGLFYSWYSSKNGFSSSVGSGASYTEASPTNGEIVYCTATINDAIINSPIDLTSNQITISAVPSPQITDIDINTICRPEKLDPSYGVRPTFSSTVINGTPPYSYQWTPGYSISGFALGSATLNNLEIPNPSVISVDPSNNPVSFLLTVTDVNGCQAQHDVAVQFLEKGYDLTSRDSHFDMYMEPNLLSEITSPLLTNDWNIWESPDLWNRINPDGIYGNQPAQFPYYSSGSTWNYLYANVRNVGCIASPYYTGNPSEFQFPYLDVYWTIGGFAGAEYWNNNPDLSFWYYDGTIGTQFHGPHGNVANGELVGIQDQIYPLNPGSMVQKGPYFWYPDPASYYFVGATSVDVCYLSRIVDYHNVTGGSYPPDGYCSGNAPGMTYAETNGDPSPNVRNNNNIVTSNSTFITIGEPGSVISPHFLLTGNVSNTTGAVSIQFINNYSLNAGLGTSLLNNFVSFEIFLGPLFDIWQAEGGYGNISPNNIDYANKAIIFDGSNTAQLDSIVMDSAAQFLVEIAPTLLKGVDPSNMPAETFFCREISDDSTEIVLGNYTYHMLYQSPPTPCQSSPGVLTINEISLGPISCPDGNYAEMLVSNCGSNICNMVNVQGWILDDNDGSFDTAGCSISFGVTQSHYRLSYDSIWQNVPVGALIIAYNANSNCYNFPDTFTVDTIYSKLAVPAPLSVDRKPEPVLPGLSYQIIYFVPIGSSELYPIGKEYVERYSMLDSALWCSYTVDSIGDTTISDSLAYMAASAWDSTIEFDPVGDAFQVRCPRCDQDLRNEPAFYHGIGFSTNNLFASITPTNTSLGGPVIFNSGLGYKYSFVGSTASDLGDPTKWQILSADAEGAMPTSVVDPSEQLLDNVFLNQLNPPCCSSGHHSESDNDKRNKSHKNDNNSVSNNGNINGAKNGSNFYYATLANMNEDDRMSSTNNLTFYCFPNPTSMMLSFEFSQQANVTIKIIDITGKEMDEQLVICGNIATFDVHTYAKGIYLYQVIMPNGVITGKVVIE